jgi:WD40 repeat protein
MRAVAVVNDLLEEGPNHFTSVAGLVAREKNTMSIVGLADGVMRLITYDVSDGKPAVTVPGLSGDFPPGSAAGAIRELFAVTATDFAIYLAVGGDGGRYALLRIPAQRSSLGKPIVLFKPSTASAHPTSMTVNKEGHLLMAMSASDKTATLRFHHATTGRTLLVLSTDLMEIHCLCYSSHGSLYAAATKDHREGIYRLDVAFDDTKQILRSVEMARLPNIVAIECLPSGDCWALVGGQHDGRLLRVDLE